MDRKNRKPTLNDRLEFLVILQVRDLKRSCVCKSLKQKIAKYAHGLNGRLHIGLLNKDTCTCCGIPFQVQGIVNVREIYVKLPKERIYVRGIHWEHEYMKSKVQELLYIFRKLGARELELNVEQGDMRSRATSADAEVSLSEYGIDADLDVGMSVEDFKQSSDSIRAKIVFRTDSDVSSSSSSDDGHAKPSPMVSERRLSVSDDEKYAADTDSHSPTHMSVADADDHSDSHPPSPDQNDHRMRSCTSICGTNVVYRNMTDVLMDPRIHYVRQFPDWIGFIRERLIGKAKHIRFNFVHHNVLIVERELRARLQHVGISFQLKEKEKGWTKMVFKASF